MAWTTPATWTAGQIVNASDLNTQIRDNENYLLNGIARANLVRVGGANYTTASVTMVDVDAANLILTLASVASGRIKAEATFSIFGSSAGAIGGFFDLIMDSTTRSGGGGNIGSSYCISGAINVVDRFITVVGEWTGLSAGSHNVKLQWCAAAGTIGMGNNGIPISMRAWEA